MLQKSQILLNFLDFELALFVRIGNPKKSLSN